MTLEIMAKTAVPYHELGKPVKKTETTQDVTQVNQNSNTATISPTETVAVKEMNKSGKEQGQEGNPKKSYGGASEQQIKTAVSEASNKLRGKRTGCEFSYHEKTNRVSIKVFDKDTCEVIREIPPEESLEMLEKIWELAGILVDEKR